MRTIAPFAWSRQWNESAMPPDRDAMLVAASSALEARPVRWAEPVLGDYDGSERTLEVFDADAADQRRLLRDLRPLRAALAKAAGGPVVVVFHTSRETGRLHAAFVARWRTPLRESRERVAAAVAAWGLVPATTDTTVGPDDIQPLLFRDAA